MSDNTPKDNDFEEDFFNQTKAEVDDDADLTDIDTSEELDKAAEEFVGARKQDSFSRILLLAIVFIASIGGIWLLFDDLAYFFANKTPINLGFAESIKLETAPPSDTYVKVAGVRQLQRLQVKSVLWTKVFFGFIGTDKVYILAPLELDDKRLKKEGLAETTYSGRLKRLGELSVFGQIKDWYLMNRGKKIKPEFLVVIENEKPQDMLSSVVVVLALFLAMLWSGYRIFKAAVKRGG